MKNKIKNILTYIAIVIGESLGLGSIVVYGLVAILGTESGTYNVWLRFIIAFIGIAFIVYNLKVLRHPFRAEPTKRKILIYNVVAIILSVIILILLLVSYRTEMFSKLGTVFFIGWIIYIILKIVCIVLDKDERKKEKEEKNKDFMIANNDDAFDI